MLAPEEVVDLSSAREFIMRHNHSLIELEVSYNVYALILKELNAISRQFTNGPSPDGYPRDVAVMGATIIPERAPLKVGTHVRFRNISIYGHVMARMGNLYLIEVHIPGSNGSFNKWVKRDEIEER